MDWSPDFCLACDRQTSGGAYCSQSCRLADIENSSSGSEPVSPASVGRPGVSWTPSNAGAGSGFYLPPPVDFEAYKAKLSRKATPPANAVPRQPYGSSRPAQVAALPSRHPIRSIGPSPTTPSRSRLTPSSSESSLSSMQSSLSQESGFLSAQARSELRGYANSFDQVRDWKRRITLT
ncbi:MAG: hypothetical protein M1832_003988 [Thelocarpon impressellum]|nr:MAG: hypothetical protein M1832_003988 [Thelocarpon impressellum]